MKKEHIAIEKILGYDVTFLRMDHLGEHGKYVNAYVLLKDSHKQDYDCFPNCTFQNGDVLGVDTIHSWNIK